MIPDPKPAAGETTNDTTCVTCGKPKFGPWSTIASGAVKDIQGYYCMCVQAFVGETTNVTQAADCTHVDAINAGKNTTCKCGAVIRFMGAPSPASSPREPNPGEQSAMDAQDYLYPVMRMALGTAFGPVAEKPEGERLCPKCQGMHIGNCDGILGERLGTCANDHYLHMSHAHIRNDRCKNWQPIAPEAASDELHCAQCEVEVGSHHLQPHPFAYAVKPVAPEAAGVENKIAELTEHLAEERAFRITSEKKCVELHSTIETLQQDLRMIKDIERAGFKRQNELQQNVERLAQYAVHVTGCTALLPYGSKPTGDAFSCSCGLERQLAELRSGR